MKIKPDNNPKILEEQKRDHALYFVEDGQQGFSPEWNKMVIERTIKKAEQLHRKKQLDYIENIRERADAVASYLKHADRKDTPIEKYFGKQQLAYLQGRKIVERLKSKLQLHSKVSRKGVKPGERKIYLPD